MGWQGHSAWRCGEPTAANRAGLEVAVHLVELAPRLFGTAIRKLFHGSSCSPQLHEFVCNYDLLSRKQHVLELRRAQLEDVATLLRQRVAEKIASEKRDEACLYKKFESCGQPFQGKAFAALTSKLPRRSRDITSDYKPIKELAGLKVA